jgi:hypothetical protein
LLLSTNSYTGSYGSNGHYRIYIKIQTFNKSKNGNEFMKSIYSTTIVGIMLALGMLVTSSALPSYGGNTTNSSLSTGNSPNTNASTVNATLTGGNTTNANVTTTSANPVVKNLGDALNSLKNNDNAAAKTNLRNAEKEMEGDPSLQSGEKHVEAALGALKDGDIKTAIDHAQQALDAAKQK